MKNESKKAMNTCRRIGVLLFLLLGAGCQTMQPARPLTIIARDAETQEPIAGARVSLRPIEGYHLPGPDLGTTGRDGIVRFQGNSKDDRAIGIEANANGYMLVSTYIPAETVRSIPAAPRFGHDTERPVAFTVELFAGPRPSVDLIVPAGYRGVVKADVAIARDAPCPPHQRKFQFSVAPDGTVHVTGPAMLERVQASDFQLRYADNAPISHKASSTDLGFWWLRHEGDADYYVIGDRGDYQLARAEEASDGGAPPPRSSGGGGGRGGRGGHHRGGGGGSAN
jgi:hypothetical protein